jgi:hypothetical protein
LHDNVPVAHPAESTPASPPPPELPLGLSADTSAEPLSAAAPASPPVRSWNPQRSAQAAKERLAKKGSGAIDRSQREVVLMERSRWRAIRASFHILKEFWHNGCP